MDQFQKLREKMAASGFEPRQATWGQAIVLTGQRRTFKWRWVGTALWENAVAFKTKKLDVPELTSFIEQAKHWAIANKRGWMRGMQSGQAIIVLVVADQITEAARQLAAKSWEIEFARFTVVAVTDNRTATIARGPKFVGAMFRPHLVKRLTALASA